MQTAIQTHTDPYEHCIINNAWTEKAALDAIKELGDKADWRHIETLLFWKYSSQRVILRVNQIMRQLQSFNIISFKKKIFYIAQPDYVPKIPESKNEGGIIIGGMIPVESKVIRYCIDCNKAIENYKIASIVYGKDTFNFRCISCKQSIFSKNIKPKKIRIKKPVAVKVKVPFTSQVIAMNVKCPKCKKRGTKTVIGRAKKRIYFYHLQGSICCIGLYESNCK